MDEKELTASIALVERDIQEITTEAEADAMGAYLKEVKAKAKALTAKRMEMTRPLDDSKKKIMAMFKPVLDRLGDLESLAKKTIVAYQSKIERLRIEEQAKREAEERRLREEQEAKAQALVDAGFTDVAEAVQAEEVEQPEPVELPRAKPAGLTERTYWRFRITDENMIPREFLMVDNVKIKKVVNELKEATAIPGIEVYSEKAIY